MSSIVRRSPNYELTNKQKEKQFSICWIFPNLQNVYLICARNIASCLVDDDFLFIFQVHIFVDIMVLEELLQAGTGGNVFRTEGRVSYNKVGNPLVANRCVLN